MIRLLEELSLNALPALQTIFYDGWLLRFAGDYSNRANSVQTLYPSTLDLDEKIACCEAAYAARGKKAVFKLTSAAEPPELAAALERHGYAAGRRTSMQTLALKGLAFEGSGAAVEIEDAVTESWLQDYHHLTGVEARHLPTVGRMLDNLTPKAGFFRLKLNGGTASIGLGVLENGYVGLYDIGTEPSQRNRGLATQMVRHILHWAQANGAHTAYLQVMPINAPALHLYEKLGFREVYQYWYMMKA
jgi:ribosomal protein S18 acetylase RimI-like enzyme